MEKDDVVLIKDIIPNCSLSKKIAEMLGTKVKVEDINRTEIKVKGIWIPKEFVKEVVFKHYTEEELARRSKIEEYCKYLTEKTTPLPLKIAYFFSDKSLTIAGIFFFPFVACFALAMILSELKLDKISLLFIFISLGIFGAGALLMIILTVFYAVLERIKMSEKFFKEVRAKTIKSLKVSEEELERFDLHW